MAGVAACCSTAAAAGWGIDLHSADSNLTLTSESDGHYGQLFNEKCLKNVEYNMPAYKCQCDQVADENNITF